MKQDADFQDIFFIVPTLHGNDKIQAICVHLRPEFDSSMDIFCFNFLLLFYTIRPNDGL